ncbi:MAG: prolyl oligopeptidase family serine peptidase [Clostridia bacterium]|nr:prolyl oligopeptidase family serine peptidase [Clostridia bacterium]
MSEKNELALYEDELREKKSSDNKVNQYSKYADQIYYESSVTPDIKLAMTVYKPEKPANISVTTHGWHMSMEKYEPREDKPYSSGLSIHVDMRGRAFSEGKPDCNGYELMDVIDAVEYVKKHYADYILDPAVVFLIGGSGGGGNVYELLNKFPDYFVSAAAMFGISDYARWYQDDYAVGEFRDEMDVWIGCSPDENPMAYQSRSGLHGVKNLLTPLFIGHGETDERVQICQARLYVDAAEKAGKGDLISYYEMKGVGTRNHTGNITDEQKATMGRMRNENFKYTTPIEIPEKGSFWVHGYLVTKHFEVWLDSIDKVADLTYDLASGSFELTCPVPVTYKIILKK